MTFPNQNITRPNSNTAFPSCLGLFPYFALDSLGGIELSARLAWEAIQSASKGPNNLILYGAPYNMAAAHPDHVLVTSKLHAVSQALRTRWEADVVLIWHIGLLKLLPFLRMPRARVVLFLHGIEIWREQDWFTQRLLNQVSCFISNSQHTWLRFLEFQPQLAKKSHQVVHLGIKSPPNTSLYSPSDLPIALIVSRMVRSEDYKGHRELISIWPLVLEKIPNAQLWLAGEGDLRPELEHIVQREGLEEYIRFWGRVTEAQKQEMLTQCRCFTMPSRNEGFGLVYLEAMAQGRPCLVSTVDAGREVINPPEAGLAVDPKNTTELCNAIVRLLTLGPEWQSWSQQAQRRYQKQFTSFYFQQHLVKALGLSPE